jgi:murein DD-endopeptidase MepM/ murein hydrolase activator NlpD
MLALSLYLPKHRLQIQISKRRSPLVLKEEALEKIEALKNVRRGSKISRVFRHLFEQKRIKAILGTNLVLLALLVSAFTSKTSALAEIPEELTTLSPGVIEMVTTKAGIRSPLDEVKISQGFSSFHPAIDLDGVTGDPVYPIMKGKVEATIYARFALGYHIIINHGNGLSSIYAHLSKIEVQPGDEVGIDQIIGRVGATGRAFGDHLHLEVIDNGRHINPRILLGI